jgi:hypothetical protein
LMILRASSIAAILGQNVIANNIPFPLTGLKVNIYASSYVTNA